MYTQCPQCATVFRINAGQLAQARGLVRCGICQHGFNALESLSEEPEVFSKKMSAAAETAEIAHTEETADETSAALAPAQDREIVTTDQAGEAPGTPENAPAVAFDSLENPAAFTEYTARDGTQELIAQPAPEEVMPPPTTTAPAFDAPEHKAAFTVHEPQVGGDALIARQTPEETETPVSTAAVLHSPNEEPAFTEEDARHTDASLTVISQALKEEAVFEAETEPTSTHSPRRPPEPGEATAFNTAKATEAAHSTPASDLREIKPFSATQHERLGTPPWVPADTTSPRREPTLNAVEESLPREDATELLPINAEARPAAAAPARTGWFATLSWTVVNLALIAVLIGQYAYFNREEIAQYPELRPWLSSLCELIGCDVPLRKDASLIVLANRVVQSHPEHEHALLIDATLINEATFTQPYPVVELRFSDLNNRLVAGRRFRPYEYLPQGANIKKGMAPKQPLRFSLEIADPGKEAVSFQFNLL